jgi:hypothetical protein
MILIATIILSATAVLLATAVYHANALTRRSRQRAIRDRRIAQLEIELGMIDSTPFYTGPVGNAYPAGTLSGLSAHNAVYGPKRTGGTITM